MSDKLEGITGERIPGEYIFHDKIPLEKITGKGVSLFHDKILFRKNYRRKYIKGMDFSTTRFGYCHIEEYNKICVRRSEID